MTVRHSRSCLRAARGLALSTAALAFTPTTHAQTAPVAPKQTAPVAPTPTQPVAPAATPPVAPAQPAPTAPGSSAALPASAAATATTPAQPPTVPAAQSPAAVVPSEPSAVTPAEDAGPPEGRKKKKKGDKADKKMKGDQAAGTGVTTAAGRIRFKGRVFALAELQHTERRTFNVVDGATIEGREPVDSLDLSVDSARIGFEYEAPLRWISAVAELELSGKPSLKDGYVQARGQHFFARMGQFKLPVSELETESQWNLPIARRGFVHDLLTDWLDVGGRRPGLMVGWRGRGGLRPRFMVGAFQGSTLSTLPAAGDRDTELLEKKSFEVQSYVARAQFEPGDIQLGAWYEHRLGSRALNETKHYFTVGADAVIDRVLTGGGIRAWVDGTVGASWYEHAQKEPDDKDALFVSGRALVGYRFGGTVDEAAYVEPFGFVALLEPDTQVRDDLAFEGALGVAAGYWRRARLALQAEVNSVQRNFPGGYLTGVLPDRMGLLLQAGVAW